MTEDAELGIRIARRGWGVRMMASVTEEEANSRLDNWIRQRSRWIKGYMQTWLVHSRHPVRLWRQLGFRRVGADERDRLQGALPASAPEPSPSISPLGFSPLTNLANPLSRRHFWEFTEQGLVAAPPMQAAATANQT